MSIEKEISIIRKNVIDMCNRQGIKIFSKDKIFSRAAQEFLCGESQNISLKTIREFSEVLGVSAIELIKEKQENDLLKVVKQNFLHIIKQKGFTANDSRFGKQKQAFGIFIKKDENGTNYEHLLHFCEVLGVKIENVMTEGYYE